MWPVVIFTVCCMKSPNTRWTKCLQSDEQWSKLFGYAPLIHRSVACLWVDHTTSADIPGHTPEACDTMTSCPSWMPRNESTVNQSDWSTSPELNMATCGTAGGHGTRRRWRTRTRRKVGKSTSETSQCISRGLRTETGRKRPVVSCRVTAQKLCRSESHVKVFRSFYRAINLGQTTCNRTTDYLSV